MLPLKNRLTKRKDFEAVSRYGKFFSFGQITLKIKENGSEETRFGISIGLKFSKLAVARNKIRRQLREIIREDLSRIKKGFDVIVMVRNNQGKKIASEKLKAMTREVLKKGRLIN